MTLHISGTMERVFSSWPDSECHDEDQMKSCEKTLSITMEPLVLIFYHFFIRFFWKRWECQTTWPASWETCMQVRKQQLEMDMEQQTGSK